MKGCNWILLALSACQVAGSPHWRPECPPLTDSGFIPHPFDCGSLYYCLGGVAHPVLCPLGAQWNQSLGRCDSNHMTPCQRSQPVVSRSSFEHGRNSLCPFDDVLMGPIYFTPNENGFQRIIKCLDGHAYMLSCSSGEYWNVERNRCDNFNEPHSISMRSGMSPSCTPMTDFDSQQLVPFLKNFGALFRCLLDKSYILMIYINLMDASPIVTSYPPTSSPSTRHTTEQATTTISPNLPVPMPQCSDPNSVVRFGIPGECKAYLQCHQGRAFKIYCRTGREWSEAANNCIETNSAGCSSGISPIIETVPTSTTTSSRAALAAARLIYTPTTYSPTSTTTPTSTLVTALPTNAPTTCSAETLFSAHPTDCRQYIQCDNGRAIIRECPHQLFWNRRLSICDWTCEL